EITVPGSKSITNRALVLAALADGETTLRGALWSEDTQVMTECLRKLGFRVEVQPDPGEVSNRTITLRGMGGKIPVGGSGGKPVELFVGNAGTAARFLAAMVCLGQGAYRLSGVARMHERPQGALFAALRQLGYVVESQNDKLPAVIHGTGPRKGKCSVSIEHSSQFASALLLCAKLGGWQVEVTGENAEESPYVTMTSKLIEAFPKSGGSFEIEPDASSGSYFWAAGELWGRAEGKPSILLKGWDAKTPAHLYQVDAKFSRFLPLPGKPISRTRDLGDSIMTAIVLAPFSFQPVKFTDLGRLRVQECERVSALRTELTKCGTKVVETGDTLEVFPSQLHGAEIETYNDHRMAMCFAILGLKVPGIKIRNPACVKKTFPDFFQKLAAAPPGGWGATIRDGKTGRMLSGSDLFAE